MRLFSGQRAWVLQRFTAVVLLVFVIAGCVWLLFGPPLAYDGWRALLASSHGAVLAVLLFVMLALHGWIGARDIVLDYVQPRGVRLALLGVIALLLVGTLIRVLLIVVAHAAA